MANKEHSKKEVLCCNCGKEFLCEYWRTIKRKNLFCSKKCEGEFRKKQSDLNCTCDFCGQKFHMKPSRLSKKHKHTYCSIECHRQAKKIYMLGKQNHQYGLLGDKNPTWKSNERISSYGYKLIRDLTHPFANSDGFVFEHRLIAEKELLNNTNSVVINNKKYLSKDYVVHHIDFNRLNNKINNLRVMKRNEHTYLHWKLRKRENLKIYCKENNLNYSEILTQNKNFNITVDDDVVNVRNGGFGSTDN